MRRGIHLFVDVQDAAVEADEKRPARRVRLILVDHAVRRRHRLGWIGQQRIVERERLRERLVGLRRIDADREVRDVEPPNLFATRPE